MDLFAFAYYGLICLFIAWSAPLQESSFRRILFGLTSGLIAVTAEPFVRTYFS